MGKATGGLVQHWFCNSGFESSLRIKTAIAKPFNVSGKAMTTQPDRQIGYFLTFCILVIA